eukprot:s1488_g2.t1
MPWFNLLVLGLPAPCSEIADSIVATGRRALEEAANFIEAMWPGAKVIYGDTDSVFVQLRGYSLEEAFKAGKDICSQVSAKHPQPVELEFEKVYMPCLCLTKKRYGGMAYAKPPSEGGTGSFEAKGLEAIRRDQCRLASNVQYEILTEFFRTKDLSAAKRIFVDHAADLLKGSYDGKHTLTDLSFFREARLGTYRAEAEDGGSATLPPQAIAARSRIAAEGEDAAPEYGERVSFAVALGPVGARLVDRCVPPASLAEAASVLLAESTPAPRISQAGYRREPGPSSPLAGPASVRLPRALRVFKRVQLRAAPSQQADTLPWVVQLPGALVLTTGRTQSGWVELHFAHGGKGWAPLSEFVNDNRHGWHGDAWEHCGGAEAAITARQAELLHVALQAAMLPTELAQGSSGGFRVEKSGQQAHVWLPDVLPHHLPLLVVLHGSRPMDWDFLSFTERWQRDAQRYRVAILIPESRGPTWDYLLTGQRQDMDFIQFAMDEVCRQLPINRGNIAVMGMSDGGSLGLSMALRNPSLFRTALLGVSCG